MMTAAPATTEKTTAAKAPTWLFILKEGAELKGVVVGEAAPVDEPPGEVTDEVRVVEAPVTVVPKPEVEAVGTVVTDLVEEPVPVLVLEPLPVEELEAALEEVGAMLNVPVWE